MVFSTAFDCILVSTYLLFKKSGSGHAILYIKSDFGKQSVSRILYVAYKHFYFRFLNVPNIGILGLPFKTKTKIYFSIIISFVMSKKGNPKLSILGTFFNNILCKVTILLLFFNITKS